MDRFDERKLEPIGAIHYRRMLRDGAFGLVCMHCGERTTYEEFQEMVEKYDHLQMAEVCTSGTHPDCWDEMFGKTPAPPCKE
jgi:hypothetical protein